MPKIVKKQLDLELDLAPTKEELERYAVALYRVLSSQAQGRDPYWIDISGNKWRLSEMKSSHLSNVRGFLLRQAETLFFFHGLGEILDAPRYVLETMEKHDIPLDVENFDDPREWLLSTPFMLRLDEILEERHADVGFEVVVEDP